MPACSQAKKVPVRPKPVMISSAIRSTSWRVHSSRARARNSQSWNRMPEAPCTSGSTMKAAISSPRAEKSASSLSPARASVPGKDVEMPARSNGP